MYAWGSMNWSVAVRVRLTLSVVLLVSAGSKLATAPSWCSSSALDAMCYDSGSSL
jgi:hypothetical protein